MSRHHGISGWSIRICPACGKHRPIGTCGCERPERENHPEPTVVLSEAAFRDLLEVAEDMRSYVPEYFATKWAHDNALDRARCALEEANSVAL